MTDRLDRIEEHYRARGNMMMTPDAEWLLSAIRARDAVAVSRANPRCAYCGRYKYEHADYCPTVTHPLEASDD